MDLTRLGGKRGRRTRAWASVCVGLFGDGSVHDTSDAAGDGRPVGDGGDANET